MKTYFVLTAAIAATAFFSSYTQAADTAKDKVITDKRGGICFRMDDNQNEQKWRQLAEVFNRHGAPFCASLNVGTIPGSYAQLIKDMQKDGHEVMDHSPLHNVTKIRPAPGKKAEDYANLPGVDHISGKYVCLKYIVPDPKKSASMKATAVKQSKDTLTLIGKPTVKREKRYYSSGDLTVFFPKSNTVLEAKPKKGEPFTYQLRSIWGEKNVELPEKDNVQVYFTRAGDFHMTREAHEIMVQNSLDKFAHIGAQRPYSWIQPGGGVSNLHAAEAKAVMGDKFGYKSAACYLGMSKKVFNEPDPKGERRFGMMWGNFDDEGKDLEWNKRSIAEKVALHHVLFGHSHMRPRKDSWEDYLKRLDALLAWCNETKIPVRTQAEWADILYGTKQDANVNIFPSLATDRDGNGTPDGYRLKNAVLQKGEGASLVSEKAGVMFEINDLAGLEKGKNSLAMQISAPTGKSVKITVTYKGSRYRDTLRYTAKSDSLEKFSGEINVPEMSATCNIRVETDANGKCLITAPSLTPVQGRRRRIGTLR